jgi:hypothetical protein
LTWVYKLLTDPFHNIALYRRSPFALLRGELIDGTDAGTWARTRRMSRLRSPHPT